MPDATVRELVNEWLVRADEDLRLAHKLSREEEFPTAACFHAQQPAEKFLKAYLTATQTEFPKTHNIAYLRTLISSANAELATRLSEIDALTDAAVDYRYPAEIPLPTKSDAHEAIRLAASAADMITSALKTLGT
ncbi:MAG: HEPN domain-containing protein [Deltaproteobacteria bacterium]|nr:HEPN domain-containing protein [Deltaproteobacteria bacterium]